MKRIKNSRQLLFLLSFLWLLASCDDSQQSIESRRQNSDNGSMMSLGRKLDNPYSIENMKRSLEILKNERKHGVNTRSLIADLDKIEIETTDLYVRFLPKDSVELDMLFDDTTLFVYDFPLDYEILNKGSFYQDPSLPKGQQITWQYTVVKPNYKFPNIKYEILSNLFIPMNSKVVKEGNSMVTRSTQQGLLEQLDELETKALSITNNLEEDNTVNTRCEQPDKWTPSGRIQIEDVDKGKIMPVANAKVRARRWFTTKSARTDSQGYYKMELYFRRPVNYSIVWGTYNFSIRESLLKIFTQKAWVDGPKQRKPWDLTLKKHTKDWFHAVIYQAAYHYYYEDIKGLKRPPLNSNWKPKMKIRARYEYNKDTDGNHNKDIRLFGLFSRIRIFNPQNNNSDIYATTIHELAHASHWELRKDRWDDRHLAEVVKESWARGVEWVLTRMKYPAYNTNYGRYNYTGVVEDLIDGVNLPKTVYYRYDFKKRKFVPFNGGIGHRYVDNVTGYTIKQIEDVLSETSSWQSWMYNLEKKYNNETEQNLYSTFLFWNPN